MREMLQKDNDIFLLPIKLNYEKDGKYTCFLAKRDRRPRVAGFIPREARPKASRSGVYNFVPQRAQAG